MNRLHNELDLLTGGAGTIRDDDSSYGVADVTKPEDARCYVQTILDRPGGTDICLANAGDRFPPHVQTLVPPGPLPLTRRGRAARGPFGRRREPLLHRGCLPFGWWNDSSEISFLL